MMKPVAIITGASSGIGEALAYEAARQGFAVVISARQMEKLQAVKARCESLNAACLAVVADVSKEADCRQLVDEAVSKFNRIDVLINNAGISMRALLKDCNLDVIRQLMDTNFWGTVYCTKFALPFLLESKGSVVGISSIAGIKGLPGRTGYSASKFAMHGFLESLRLENLKTGLHVLVACPGYTASNIRNTALNHEGRGQSESPLDESKLMQPEEVASKVFAAIKKRKRYIYLSFEGKATNFLNKFFSAWLDKLVYKKVAAEKDSPFK
ncbi:MAG: SDR family oxidoreductase [Bacteroidetes bacterium]|nr:SDR family oxidoreductase [Bacteroidota bacterium]